MITVLVVVGVLGAVVGVSFLVEALRTAPVAPAHLSWNPALTPRYVDVDGVRLRYVETGRDRGPTLVLLHTLRTQLDMFQKVIPQLTNHFRVYAFDLPGHGYSDIPNGPYTAGFFVATMAKALDRLDIHDTFVVGESIGGTIALLLAARRPDQVRGVVAVNPYDYGGGRGLRRSSWLANLIFGLDNVPVLGATVNRLGIYPIFARILRGGVHRRNALPRTLAYEMYRVGNRPGYRQAFSSLVRNWSSWEAAHVEYPRVERPTLLVYGEYDWSRPEERAATAAAIPDADLRTVADAGHFLSLDAPDEFVAEILAWPRAPRRQRLVPARTATDT